MKCGRGRGFLPSEVPPPQGRAESPNGPSWHRYLPRLAPTPPPRLRRVVPPKLHTTSRRKTTVVCAPQTWSFNMSTPVLVTPYKGVRPAVALRTSNPRGAVAKPLPPVSSYAFASILRSADSPELQAAIDGIADICAKNHMSLAHEYASHLPPLGEITTANSSTARPPPFRPGRRRALTSVPEVSSGSSQGSDTSHGRGNNVVNFRWKREEFRPLRTIRIGSMGRTISVRGTIAVSGVYHEARITQATFSPRGASEVTPRRSSEAKVVLRNLLAANGRQPT